MTAVRSLLLGLCAVLLCVAVASADDKKDKPAKKSGSVTGEITAKDKDNKWIEVKADGEEKARKYIPHWRGGAPKDGGGPDKEMVKVFTTLKVGSRIQLDWEFEEHLRAVKIDVLKEKP